MQHSYKARSIPMTILALAIVLTAILPARYTSASSADLPVHTADTAAIDQAYQLVALQSSLNGKYINAGQSGSGYLAAVSEDNLDTEIFRLISLGDDKIALQSNLSKKFVRAGVTSETLLAAVSDAILAWETFRLIPLEDGKVALQSDRNGKYVRAGVTGESRLAATSDHVLGWETFNLIRLSEQMSASKAFQMVDVTEATGKTIVDRVTSWQTPDGPYHVKHVAGRTPENDLVVFWWRGDGKEWRVVNVSDITGQKIDGSVTSWQTPNGPYNVEHLAGRAPNGDLLVFYWQPDGKDWRVVNVSEITGQKIDGSLTSWQTPNGPYNVEHLADHAPNGDLLVFYWQPDGKDWRVVNVSEITGQKIDGSLTSWQTPNGPYNVEHLAGRATNGDLLVFYWQPDGKDWRVVNVSEITGQKIDGPVTSWQTPNGPYNVEHLAGRATNGDLLVFYWQPDGKDWRVVNVSEITGQKINGAPSAYQIQDGAENVEVIAGRGLDNSLLMFWWKPSRDRQAINVSHATRQFITTDPEPWQTLIGNQTLEQFATTGHNGNLLVVWGDDASRRLTDRIGQPFQQIKHIRQRKLLTILWDWHNPADDNKPMASRADVEKLLFGPSNSVRDYFDENSHKRFEVVNAGVLGWYDANKPFLHYCLPDQEDLPEDLNCNERIDVGEDRNGNGKLDGPDGVLQAHEDKNGNGKLDVDLDGDGFVSGHLEKWSEAIRQADRDINFAAFDINSDGHVDQSELGILNIIASGPSFGQCCHQILERQVPEPKPLVVDGVTVGPTLEVYAGRPLHFGLITHELAHLLLAYEDMYFCSIWGSTYNPFSATVYSILDRNPSLPGHIDPVHKLKSGWLKPQVVFNSGPYQLSDIRSYGQVLILIDPQRSTDEYFVIENRWPGDSYDRNLPDAGLAIWHFMENPEIYRTVAPPPGTPPEKWPADSPEWERRAIRMIRPVIGQSINSCLESANDSVALWDGSDANTGYDLLSTPSEPNQAALRWADGSPSGFAIKNISCAGEQMSLYVDVPWSTANNSSTEATQMHNCVTQEVKPVVNDGGPVMRGEVTRFTASISTGDDTNFTWDFGDGTTASGAEVTHTYVQAGEFTVTIVASNAAGTVSTTTTISVAERETQPSLDVRIFLPLVGIRSISADVHAANREE